VTPVTRFVALVVVLLLAGMPVVGLVCAHECSAPVERTALEAEHCHTPEPGDTAAFNAEAPAGCDSPFAFTNVAARERTATPVGPAPLSDAPPQVRDVALVRHDQRIYAFALPSRAVGLTAGAPVPLRI
jgi:hypothetical protein